METTTAGDILNDVAVELGLVRTAMEDPYASTDQNIIQLRALLNRTGKRLARFRAWSQLQKTHTFSTAGSTASYALPADFWGFLTGTPWNRTVIRPLVVAEPVRWQAIQAGSPVGPLDLLVRIYGNLMYLSPTPSAVETVAFEYQSTRWVLANGETTPSKTKADAEDDVLWFDEDLLAAALRFEWLQRKGMATPADQEALLEALGVSGGNDGTAPILSLSGGEGFRLLDTRNLPDTGWGT